MAIHTDVRSFNLALGRYGQETVPSIQQGRLTVIALTGAKSLTERTPVDTGRAKGNWQFTVGEPAEGEIERLEPSPEGTPATQVQADVLAGMQRWRPGDWIWFHNGVPYIQILNDGTESRTGHHMVELTRDHIEGWLRGGG